MMEEIDGEHTGHPARGVEAMIGHLFLLEFPAGSKRVRRQKRQTRITSTGPEKYPSKLGKPQYRMPYLLRCSDISCSSLPWNIGITFIPMIHGFTYPTVKMDMYNRCMMAWRLCTTRWHGRQHEVLRLAVEPVAQETTISDQGSLHASNQWPPA